MTPELLTYVRQRQEQGANLDVLVKELAPQGWTSVDVQKAIATINIPPASPIQTPTSTPAPAPVFSPAPTPPPISTPTPAYTPPASPPPPSTLPITPITTAPITQTPTPTPTPDFSSVPSSQVMPNVQTASTGTSPLVVNKKKTSMGKKILIILVILIIIAGGIFFVVRYALNGFLSSIFSPTSSTTEPIGTGTGISTEIVPLSAMEYEAYLSKDPTPFALQLEAEYKGSKTSAGPALVTFDNFWLDVSIPVIPNLADQKEQSDLTIDHIWSKSGVDINDGQGSFESDIFFTNLDFSRKEMPVPHLHTTRSLHLVKDAKESDIGSISGNVILKLPLLGGEFLIRSYPFNLVIGQNTIGTSTVKIASSTAQTGSSTPISQLEKDALVTAVINLQSVMATKDVAKIRAYLNIAKSGDPVMLSQIYNSSDSEILLGASLISNQALTDAKLRASTTEWIIVGNKATIVIHTSASAKTTLTLQKIGGVWY